MVEHLTVNQKVAGSSPAWEAKVFIAQLVEQRTHNPLVVGSNPTGDTKTFKIKMKENLSISEAIDLAKSGSIIYRRGWNGKRIYLYYSIPTTLAIDVVRGMQSMPDAAKRLLIEKQGVEKVLFISQMHLVKPEGVVVGWSPSTEDACTKDWVALDYKAVAEASVGDFKV